MLILIKYRSNINIRMTDPCSKQISVSFKIDTQEELRKCLSQVLDQHKLYGSRTLYLDNLYVEDSYKFKYFPNHIIQYQFNEVIQALIEVKEYSRICAYNVNNIILNVKFHDYTDRSSTKLVEKLIQVYNTSQSIKISLDTGIALSEIEGSLVDKDLSVCYVNDQIILKSKNKIQPNIIFSLNREDVNSSSEASQHNDELTEEELKTTKYRTVEDGLVEEVVEPTGLTLPRYNDDNCDTM